MSIRSKVPMGFLAAGLSIWLLVPGTALGLNRSGVWKGSTSQDRTIRFEVEGDTITAVNTSVLHRACNLTVAARSSRTEFPIRDDGTFTMRFFGSEGRDRVVIRGEFTSRRRANGVVRSFQASSDCRETLTPTWTVRRRSG
jgi:hypothetical protein